MKNKLFNLVESKVILSATSREYFRIFFADFQSCKYNITNIDSIFSDYRVGSDPYQGRFRLFQ